MELDKTQTPFFNRSNELRALERAWSRKNPIGQMAMIYGRRRQGKTYLLQRFFSTPSQGGRERKYCYFLADQTTAHEQRLALASQMLISLPTAAVESAAEIAVTWNSLLRFISAEVRARPEFGTQRYGLILDEFPYLVTQTPELPSIVQAWWDREGIQSPLMVILCGSQLSAMSALGAETAPLFGRFSAGVMHIDPMRYDDIAQFYAGSDYTAAEKLTLFGALGGTPRYHALIDSSNPMDDEIVDTLIRPKCPLENEIDYLLGSEQIRDPAPYNSILSAIANGETKFSRLAVNVTPERSAYILRTLIELGFVTKEISFGETSDRRSLYRVADPFVGFWYRFVAPLSSALQFGEAKTVYEQRIRPYLADYMGSQVFETVCKQWLERYAQTRLGLTIRNAGRYWSRDGAVEIDVMAELDSGSCLFGECKWSASRPIGLGVLVDLQAKAARLPRQDLRNNATYVLFALGGFAPELIALAKDPDARLHLIGPHDLLPA